MVDTQYHQGSNIQRQNPERKKDKQLSSSDSGSLSVNLDWGPVPLYQSIWAQPSCSNLNRYANVNPRPPTLYDSVKPTQLPSMFTELNIQMLQRKPIGPRDLNPFPSNPPLKFWSNACLIDLSQISFLSLDHICGGSLTGPDVISLTIVTPRDQRTTPKNLKPTNWSFEDLDTGNRTSILR